MTDCGEREFKTVSIHLAACLLCIPGSKLAKVAPRPSIDGKRIIHIRYPSRYEETAQRLIQQFLHRTLSINLYEFNKRLNVVRDCLLRDQARPMERCQDGEPRIEQAT